MTKIISILLFVALASVETFAASCQDYQDAYGQQILMRAAEGSVEGLTYPIFICATAEGILGSFAKADESSSGYQKLKAIQPIWEDVQAATLKVVAEFSSSGEIDVDGVERCFVNDELREALGGSKVWNKLKQSGAQSGIDRRMFKFIFVSKKTCAKYSRKVKKEDF